MDANEVVITGRQLKKLITKKMEPILKDSNLRQVELDILVFISRHKDADTAKEIIKKNHLSKSHISQCLDNLKNKGYIRIEEDEEDHRTLHIIIENKAYNIIKHVLEVYGECCYIMQSGITEEELEIMKKVFLKMSQNIQNELSK